MIPEPFDVGQAQFLAGESLRNLDVDDVFAKPFRRMLAEALVEAPDEIAIDARGPGMPSLFADGVTIHDVPCGVVMTVDGGRAIGGYLWCDVGVDPDWQGRGLGAELIIERCLRSGENPTWNLDSASYSRAGVAAHIAAWRHVRQHQEETDRRVARLRDRGYPA